MKDALMKTKIVCRICKGDHWTTKCPFKDSKMAENALDIGLNYSNRVGTDAGDEAAAKTASGKYVPPSQRAGAGGRGEMMADRRDDYFTLRITNLRCVSCN
jgi:translation initiation factor 3 subunit G